MGLSRGGRRGAGGGYIPPFVRKGIDSCERDSDNPRPVSGSRPQNQIGGPQPSASNGPDGDSPLSARTLELIAGMCTAGVRQDMAVFDSALIFPVCGAHSPVLS